MKANFSTLAYSIHRILTASGLAISRGHVQQLLAASLGYGSFAAFQASTEEQPGLAGADYVILDVAGLEARTQNLGYGSSIAPVTQAIATAIKADPEPPLLFLDASEFIDEVVHQFADENVLNHDAVSSAAAETNAYFDEVNLEASEPADALKDSPEFWEVPVSGNIGMEQDPDKVFSGDSILVDGVVRIWKAGRVCLTDDMELDIGAGVDDSGYYDVEE